VVEVKVTHKTLEDIEAIAEYISRDSIKFAKVVTQNIFKSILLLEDFPELGRIVPELNSKNIREIILGNYRIIYWIISKNRIDVIAIHHSAQRIKKSQIRQRKK
jgi:toxin ParE1/3/4